MRNVKLVDMPSRYKVAATGDQHIPHVDFAFGAGKNMRRWVKGGKNRYWVSNGDQSEAVAPTHKFFSVDKHSRMGRLSDQRDAFISTFGSVADKCLGLIDGNHEYRYHNIYLQTPDIAKEFNVPDAEKYNGYCASAKYHFPGWKLWCWHGSGSITSTTGEPLRRRLNRLLSLKRRIMYQQADCDVMVAGHYHFADVLPPSPDFLLVTDDDLNVQQHYPEPQKIPIDKKSYYIHHDQRWYGCSGSMLKGYVEGESTYVEMKGLRPSELGMLIITVKDEKVTDVEVKRL